MHPTARSHLLQCNNCPEGVKQALRSDTRSTKGAKEKWEMSANKKGLFTAPKGASKKTGIFLRHGKDDDPAAASDLKKNDGDKAPVENAACADTDLAPPVAPGGLANCRAYAGSPDHSALLDSMDGGIADDFSAFLDTIGKEHDTFHEGLRSIGMPLAPGVNGEGTVIGLDTGDIDPSILPPTLTQNNEGVQDMRVSMDYGTTSGDGYGGGETHGGGAMAWESPFPSSDQTGPRPAQLVTPENCPISAGSSDLHIGMDLFNESMMM